jgi:hypothetical protein
MRRRQLLAREVLRLAFYLPHDHADLAPGVSHALQVYMRAVGEGPRTIRWVLLGGNEEGAPLDEESWSYVRRVLESRRRRRFPQDFKEEDLFGIEKRGFWTKLRLSGGPGSRNGYEFRYLDRIPWEPSVPDSVSILTATLPMEFLEAHGAAKVRELAIDMASQLRFASGHAGLALCLYWPLRTTDDLMRAELARHPGIDLRTAWGGDQYMGLQVDGVHWLNFFAQPVLGQLGGATALRARLRSSSTTVREMDSDRVVVALGEGPEAGDLSIGQSLPAYRELARVMEPWLEPLHLAPSTGTGAPPRSTDVRFTDEEARRWWRRFLD